MTIYNIIALGYLIYSFDSIYDTIKALVKREISFFDLFSCAKCFAFWSVLALSQSLVYASLVSLVVFLLDSFITTKL